MRYLVWLPLRLQQEVDAELFSISSLTQAKPSLFVWDVYTCLHVSQLHIQTAY